MTKSVYVYLRISLFSYFLFPTVFALNIQTIILYINLEILAIFITTMYVCDHSILTIIYHFNTFKLT